MAKKNLQRRVLDVSRISSINVLAGILFVGPDPPIPSKIFFSSFLILNFSFASKIDFSLSKILGFSCISIFNFFFKSFFGASIIFCSFLSKKGYC